MVPIKLPSRQKNPSAGAARLALRFGFESPNPLFNNCITLHVQLPLWDRLSFLSATRNSRKERSFDILPFRIDRQPET